MTTDGKKPLATRIRGKVNGLIETWKFDNRWQLLADELLAGRALKIYRLKGIDVIADHRTGDHLGGVRGVLASDEYRGLLREIPVETVRTVMDLGAHVGGFVLLLKSLGAALERVLCVEPNPVSRIKLQFNLQYNGIVADIFAGAISDSCGTADLYFGKMSTGFSLLAGHPNLEERRMEVETLTLDILTDRYFPGMTIDICKMDVEGAEFEILLGRHAETLANCRFLICEIHSVSGYKTSDLIEAIGQRGFLPVPVRGTFANETLLFRHDNMNSRPLSSLAAHALETINTGESARNI